MTTCPKRLIEVDLPIARISAHARREKSIRHGHISTLHIWWARRPLAACRAVICAALWPDPADPLCPQAFRDRAAELITTFARKASTTKHLLETCSQESLARWEAIAKSGVPLDPADADHQNVLRFALLDFIADFANWDNSTGPEYLETSRALTQAAHEALGGESGTRPLVVDPFAGGGSIPLEALRVGADAFASDLNPVAVLLNKVLLEYVPKFGKRLADAAAKWGKWIVDTAKTDLGSFYPLDPDGAAPVAYLWARTIRCEGPGCGVDVPLIRSPWLIKRGKSSVALRLTPNPRAKRIDFEIIESAKAKEIGAGTVKRGSVTCPMCGYTTPVACVREQLKQRRGGTTDARLFSVVTTRPGQQGRSYRLATVRDLDAVVRASAQLAQRAANNPGPLSFVPNETLDVRGIRHTWAMIYGLEHWSDYFTVRQSLTLASLCRSVAQLGAALREEYESDLAAAIQTVLGLAVSRLTDICNSLCVWSTSRGQVIHAFSRQALPMMWDFAEPHVFADAAGNYDVTLTTMIRVLEECSTGSPGGTAGMASATSQTLPTDAADALITDPPYYDAVPYAYLSDFFYAWLRRAVGGVHRDLFRDSQVPKDPEIVVDRPHELSTTDHDIAFYESELTRAFTESRRIVKPGGVAVVVFASKTTASWEAILKAVVDAGWTITGSWPVDTERESRVSAQGQARLASSVHLVCRPRETCACSAQTNIGEWRDVLTELPIRIHQWMPRLAQEGVVGADAIFACLGPALEVFSRYSRVEKASGEAATLREYLEYVWAAVSTEALSMIFKDADAGGLEPDSRLTAMWLWTLGAGNGKADTNGTGPDAEDEADAEDDAEEPDDAGGKAAKVAGYVLEFDAARKIAMGLGAHLEKSESIVEVKGNKARLLPVAERVKYLFGKDADAAPTSRGKKKSKAKQKSLFTEIDEAEAAADGWGDMKGPPAGATALDRLHQAMLLFAAGRGELLKRFLVEEGVGTDARFWKLAQALSALYPRGSDEKRWVEGVLARKKGLGF